MWNIYCPARFVTTPLSALYWMLCVSGCGSLTERQVALPNVDPSAAAAEAIRLYDKDGDGSLNESEFANCPAITIARGRYDKDGDKKISQDEIAKHLDNTFSTSVGLLEVQCTITRKGQPLSGAKVRFVPEPFLGDSVQTAVATSDASGLAIPSIPADQLPKRLANASMMQVGLYRVEIEHPSLSAEAVKQLGFEVDPTRRDGTTARFDL